MFGVTDKDIQFGRQASVIFDNYSTGESILINDYSKIFDENGKRLPMLRVGFEFTKSLDENTNWSTGNVKIYGLTLETFNKLGDYLELHARLGALKDVLTEVTDRTIDRIECFDISHTMGEATIGSCVVFDQGGSRRRDYRQYAIHDIVGGDDYAAMKQVLTRRYKKQPLPDLLLIDGGKGQVSMAMQVWADLGLNITILGIAKGPERKAGLEELILPQSGEVFRLPDNHPALHLLQTVRDESHRFAITGHRKKRAKARVQSSLLEIPGVGATRRKNLLTRFGGLRGIMAASKDDIAQVEGISNSLAQKIYDALHTS